MKTAHPATESGASARRYGATASLLTVALGASGVLTYAFFVIASHALDADSYGALVVLWTGVFITVSAFFRPVELLLSRTISEREAHGSEIGGTLRIAGAIQLGLAITIIAIALVLRGPIEDQLLDGRDALYYSMLGAVLAYAGAFFGRGLLAGRRRFGLFAALLLTESTVRLAFAAIVAIGIADGVDVVALGVLVGPFLSLSGIPLAFTRRGRSQPEPHPEASGSGPAQITLGHGSAFAAALFVALLCEQVLLTSGPLFARDESGTAAAGFMFNILLVARAPGLLFQAVAASLLPHLTRLRSTGDEDGDEAFRLSVRLTLGVVSGFAAIVIVAVLAIGPQVMQIGFGDEFDYDRIGLGVVALGMGFYLGGATLNQAAVARGRARGAALCWVVSALLFIVWTAIGPLEIFRRVEIGFALSTMTLCAGLALLYRRGDSTESGAVLESGSPQEVEATLAAAEEAT
ncbi:hypothetical protein BH10ACT11_BH10ACT11_04380 [soil metagenome]